jgi:hypothetical protein
MTQVRGQAAKDRAAAIEWLTHARTELLAYDTEPPTKHGR